MTRRDRRVGHRGWRSARILFSVGLLLVAACGRPSQERWRSLQGEPEVRIGLLVRAPDAMLTLQGDHELVAAEGQQVTVRPGVLRVAALDGVVRVWTEDGRERSSPDGFELHPRLREARFHLGDHDYRGRLRLVLDEGRLTLINVLSLETYLRGVVPWEIGWRDEPERGAVEAQAIAARTYAYKRLGQYEEDGYDLLPTVQDQVYRGTTREDDLANDAIERTRGLVLTAANDLCEAYYSSTCGGHTSRIEEVWDKPPAPYLIGGADRPQGGGTAFCTVSKHFRWSEAWSGADIESVIEETLPRELEWPADAAFGDLVDLRLQGRDSSGRVATLEVETTTGTWSVHGDRIRWVLSPAGRTILRSILFDMSVERQNGAIVRVVVEGGGNGHGVGMCQMGAIEMARRGYDRGAILGHYYPATILSSLY